MIALSVGTRFAINRETVGGRAMFEGHTVHIRDVNADPDYRNPRLGKVGTLLGVPLLREGVVVGSISLARERMEGFTERHIAVVESFAAQAVIAMENARLLTETREALEQQTGTAEVLQVINSSPGNLTPVFEAMLDKALALCNAAFGIMLTFDGRQFHHAAVRNVPEAFAECRARNAPIFGPETSPGRHRSGENIVHFPDMMTLNSYKNREPGSEVVDLGGARTLLSVALRSKTDLLGTLAIYRQEVRPFSDKEIALLENFAAQAVIAMENARLLTETREALEQQTATAEVLQVINASPGELAPVFDAMLDRALRLCGGAYGSLLTFDGEKFLSVATRGDTLFADWARQRGPFEPPSEGPLHRSLKGEDIVEITDLLEHSEIHEDPVIRRMVELGGYRSLLNVALRKENAFFGVVAIYRKEDRPFDSNEIALLQNFAAQAVIAMESARLLTETREALEQQTATADVLQAINSSPGDLAPVFDVMLSKAMRLCGAAFGELYSLNGECFIAVAVQGVPSAFAEFRARHPTGTDPRTITGRVRAGEPIVHVVDCMAEDIYREGEPTRRALVDLGGARTVLAMPLRKDEALLGMIMIYRQEVRPFSDKQIALLQNFAAQAVIAMENARLLTETREALEQQTATAEVLQVINSSPGDLAPVFDAMLEKAVRLCDAAFGILWSYDGEHFHATRLRDVAPAFAEFLREPMKPVSGGTFSRLIAGEPIAEAVDIAGSESYRAGTSRLRHAFFDLGGAQTALFVALRKEKLLGAFTIYRKEIRPFTEKQIALVTSFAAQAVIAMENARLLDELRQRTDQVAELNRGLEARVAEQVEELGRVGRLKRFLAPQLAELIVSQGNEKILESHRREIVVVFCDLRGYTAFAETAEPEEVLEFLRDYHGALGPLVSQFEGTLDQFSGDGIMVFFNDPVPIPDPAARAVNMAVAMREAAGTLITDWRERGRDLGFGAGIAQGYATLGQIGFSERSGYTAIGTVCNVAARLCAEAKDGQILLSQRVNVALRGSVVTEQVGALALKGLTQPVVAYNVPLAATQPAFRVIEGGAPSA
jgi:GAF domain-containing protein